MTTPLRRARAFAARLDVGACRHGVASRGVTQFVWGESRRPPPSPAAGSKSRGRKLVYRSTPPSGAVNTGSPCPSRPTPLPARRQGSAGSALRVAGGSWSCRRSPGRDFGDRLDNLDPPALERSTREWSGQPVRPPQTGVRQDLDQRPLRSTGLRQGLYLVGGGSSGAVSVSGSWTSLATGCSESAWRTHRLRTATLFSSSSIAQGYGGV